MELPGLERRDELGDMARSIERFRIKAAEKVREEAKQDEERRTRLRKPGRWRCRQMAENVENATKSAVGEVASGTDRMARRHTDDEGYGSYAREEQQQRGGRGRGGLHQRPDRRESILAAGRVNFADCRSGWDVAFANVGGCDGIHASSGNDREVVGSCLESGDT